MVGIGGGGGGVETAQAIRSELGRGDGNESELRKGVGERSDGASDATSHVGVR